jgi:hypothetical protein
MPATANNAPANSQAGQAASQAQGAAMLVPFARAAKPHIEQGATQASGTWSTLFQQQFAVPTYGYLSELDFTVTGSGGVNGTNTVTASADAPYNVFSNILLMDVNGTPIWNLDGYGSYLARLLGGYKIYRPDASTFGYTAISTGASGTGNFKYKVELPVEFAQDGLGCLPNMDASAQYRVNLTYTDPSTFYGTTKPGTVPGLSTLLEGRYRNRPAGADAYGNPQETQPPASGTVGYWTSQTFSVSSGGNTLQLSRVGNLIRNHILVFRYTDGTRANADANGTTPTVIEFDWDSGIRYLVNTDTQRQLNYEMYGFDVPAGVVAFPNAGGPNGLQGHEYGDSWLPTVGSTKLQLRFTSSAAGTLQVITNDFVPGSAGVFGTGIAAAR